MSPIGRRCARREHRPRASLAARAPRVSRFVVVLLSLGLASLAGAQQNLGFETLDGDAVANWIVAGGSAEAASGIDAAEGARSLALNRTEPGVTRVTQRVPAAQLRATGAS